MSSLDRARDSTRRDVLRRAVLLAAGGALAACRAPGGDALRAVPSLDTTALRAASAPVRAASAPAAHLPAPDLDDARIQRFVAGVRPFRRGGVRVERETFGDRVVVHDYGHGGAGVTLSWGCADEVLELLLEVAEPPARVAVLGAGVSGLTVAHRLSHAGFAVRVLARERSPRTTSDLAGAQWAPSVVDHGETPSERARFERWLRRSHAAFGELTGSDYGVFPRANYATADGRGGLAAIPSGLFPPADELERLPFPGPARRGFRYPTFLIEPPRFLPKLTHDLEARGVALEDKTFERLDDVLALPERLIVDCLGLGAGRIFDDTRVEPIRGQLVLLEPQELPYLLCHTGGYLFPRGDAVVLGGTVERGVRSTDVDPTACREILERHRNFFAG